MPVWVPAMPHRAGQVLSRERVGLSSSSQARVKSSAKIRCQTATGARPPTSTRANNCGESGSPYSLSVTSEFCTNQEHNVQNLWGDSTGLPKCCAETPPGSRTDRASLTHRGSYLCQPNWVGKKHPSHRGK